MVAGFVCVFLVCPGTPCRSLDSFGFAGFVQILLAGSLARFGSSRRRTAFVCVHLIRPGAPWGLWVRTDSSDSALVVTVFLFVPLVHQCAPFGSLDSLQFV